MTKHEYICQVCEVVASKSDCFKRKVGAVFVNQDYEILATGYNAPPRGFEHCDRTGDGPKFAVYGIGSCGEPCTRNIHAEMNAIAQAAKRGTALRDSILYCTYMPCKDCARMLINVGVKTVSRKVENDDEGLVTLIKGGIYVESWLEK